MSKHSHKHRHKHQRSDYSRHNGYGEDDDILGAFNARSMLGHVERTLEIESHEIRPYETRTYENDVADDDFDSEINQLLKEVVENDLVDVPENAKKPLEDEKKDDFKEDPYCDKRHQYEDYYDEFPEEEEEEIPSWYEAVINQKIKEAKNRLDTISKMVCHSCDIAEQQLLRIEQDHGTPFCRLDCPRHPPLSKPWRNFWKFTCLLKCKYAEYEPRHVHTQDCEILELEHEGTGITTKSKNILACEFPKFVMDTVEVIQEFISYTSKTITFKKEEERPKWQNIKIRSNYKNELMLVMFGREINSLIPSLKRYFKDGPGRRCNVVSIYCHNTKWTSQKKSKMAPVFIYGILKLRDKIGPITVDYLPNTHAEFNSAEVQQLGKIMIDYLEPTEETTVVDVGSSMGALSLMLAQKCDKVIGVHTIENDLKLIEDLKIRNNVHNASFLTCNPKEVSTKCGPLVKRCISVAAVNLSSRYGKSNDIFLTLRSFPTVWRIALYGSFSSDFKKHIPKLTDYNDGDGFLPMQGCILDKSPTDKNGFIMVILFERKSLIEPSIDKSIASSFKLNLKVETKNFEDTKKNDIAIKNNSFKESSSVVKDPRYASIEKVVKPTISQTFEENVEIPQWPFNNSYSSKSKSSADQVENTFETRDLSDVYNNPSSLTETRNSRDVYNNPSSLTETRNLRDVYNNSSSIEPTSEQVESPTIKKHIKKEPDNLPSDPNSDNPFYVPRPPTPVNNGCITYLLESNENSFTGSRRRIKNEYPSSSKDRDRTSSMPKKYKGNSRWDRDDSPPASSRKEMKYSRVKQEIHSPTSRTSRNDRDSRKEIKSSRVKQEKEIHSPTSHRSKNDCDSRKETKSSRIQQEKEIHSPTSRTSRNDRESRREIKSSRVKQEKEIHSPSRRSKNDFDSRKETKSSRIKQEKEIHNSTSHTSENYLDSTKQYKNETISKETKSSRVKQEKEIQNSTSHTSENYLDSRKEIKSSRVKQEKEIHSPISHTSENNLDSESLDSQKNETNNSIIIKKENDVNAKHVTIKKERLSPLPSQDHITPVAIKHERLSPLPFQECIPSLPEQNNISSCSPESGSINNQVVIKSEAMDFNNENEIPPKQNNTGGFIKVKSIFQLLSMYNEREEDETSQDFPDFPSRSLNSNTPAITKSKAMDFNDQNEVPQEKNNIGSINVESFHEFSLASNEMEAMDFNNQDQVSQEQNNIDSNKVESYNEFSLASNEIEEGEISPGSVRSESINILSAGIKLPVIKSESIDSNNESEMPLNFENDASVVKNLESISEQNNTCIDQIQPKQEPSTFDELEEGEISPCSPTSEFVHTPSVTIKSECTDLNDKNETPSSNMISNTLINSEAISTNDDSSSIFKVPSNIKPIDISHLTTMNSVVDIKKEPTNNFPSHNGELSLEDIENMQTPIHHPAAFEKRSSSSPPPETSKNFKMIGFKIKVQPNKSFLKPSQAFSEIKIKKEPSVDLINKRKRSESSEDDEISIISIKKEKKDDDIKIKQVRRNSNEITLKPRDEIKKEKIKDDLQELIEQRSILKKQLEQEQNDSESNNDDHSSSSPDQWRHRSSSEKRQKLSPSLKYRSPRSQRSRRPSPIVCESSDRNRKSSSTERRNKFRRSSSSMDRKHKDSPVLSPKSRKYTRSPSSSHRVRESSSSITRKYERSSSPASRRHERSLSPITRGYGRSPSPMGRTNSIDRRHERSLSPVSRRYVRSPSPVSRRYIRSPSPASRRYGRSPSPFSQRYERFPSPVSRRYVRSPSPVSRRYVRSPSPVSRRYERSPSPVSRRYERFPSPISRIYGLSPSPIGKSNKRSPSVSRKHQLSLSPVETKDSKHKNRSKSPSEKRLKTREHVSRSRSKSPYSKRKTEKKAPVLIADIL